MSNVPIAVPLPVRPKPATSRGKSNDSGGCSPRALRLPLGAVPARTTVKQASNIAQTRCPLARLAACAAIALLALGVSPRPAAADPCTGDNAPAGAFWSACLTVGRVGNIWGYLPLQSIGMLSDTSVGSLTVASVGTQGTGGTSVDVFITFGANNAPSTVAGDWTFHYGASTADFSNGTYQSSDGGWEWSLTSNPWSQGDTVTVALSGATPTVATEIPDQDAEVGTPFSYQFPENTFDFIEPTLLSYTATDGAGDPLPSWLSFDASTRTLSGTPTTFGEVSVKVTATHGSNSVDDTFTLNVTADRCPGQNPPAGAFWSACMEVGGTNFLGYSAFNANTGSVSDTSVGSYTLTVIAYHVGGAVLAFLFDPDPGITVLRDWTFHYGASTLDLSSISFEEDVWSVPVATAPWSSGEQVTVAFSRPAPSNPDPDPDPDPSNAAPTVTVTAASTTVAAGGTVALTATASDSDGRITSYSWGARPVSRSYYSTTTGKFSTTSGAETVWTAPERADKYQLRVRVFDDDGDTAHATVTITVDDVEPVPALPAAGLALLAFVLAVRGARGVRTRAVPPIGSRLSAKC